MPLPTRHTGRLDKDLAAHEQRLNFLRERIAHFTEEANAHELIIGLGCNPIVIEALAQVHDDAAVAEELVRDPHTFARLRGIDLPDGAQLEAHDAEGTMEVSMRIGHGPWDYSCVWHAGRGFSLVQHATPDHSAERADEPAEQTTNETGAGS